VTIRAETSPKIVKKGDYFVQVTITNNTDDQMTLKKVEVDVPEGFQVVKSRQQTKLLE
jgi:hypothetical protein